MGNDAARTLGMAEATRTVEHSVVKIVELLDTATREAHGGKFLNLDENNEIPW